MANMSYCRFSNTLSDLRDCYDAMPTCGPGDDIRPEERHARMRLVKLCAQIAADYEDFADSEAIAIQRERDARS